MVVEQRLHSYMLNQANAMSEEWLQGRDSEEGCIYSITASKEIEEKLRKQHIRFTGMLADCIADNYDPRHWARETAIQRLNANIPLHRVLQNFSRCRMICWRYIQQFAEDSSHEVAVSHITLWSMKYQVFFDNIIEVFTTHYRDFDAENSATRKKMISQMGVPVIPITDDIGILPLVGEIDTFRASIIQEQTLNKASHLGLQHLIIDLSGVYSIDTLVADELFTVINQLSLLGIQAIITGIRPEIAQTSIQLGLDFSHILKFGSLKVALAYLLQTKHKVRI